MKLITILDDKPSEHLGLAHEHGLSFFVEQNGHRVLFDFGSGIHTLENMRRLNIAPDSVEYAVGSHGHYDHAGGYPFLEEAGMHCPLVTGEGYFLEKYAGEGSRYTYLGTGFDADLLQRKGIRHRVCSSEIKLNASMTVMTAFERRWDFETIPEVCTANGEWHGSGSVCGRAMSDSAAEGWTDGNSRLQSSWYSEYPDSRTAALWAADPHRRRRNTPDGGGRFQDS